MKKSLQFLWTTRLQKSVKEGLAELLLQVRHLWEKIFDVSVLRAGLKNADTRLRTLNLIEKLGARSRISSPVISPVLTSSYTYFHVLSRSLTPSKLLEVRNDVALTR
jgi:hypothetical protein